MGRPPIGEEAMSGAERTRKYRERLRHDRPLTKQAGADVEPLKARIRELEVELARARAAKGGAQRTTDARKVFFPGIYAVQVRRCFMGAVLIFEPSPCSSRRPAGTTTYRPLGTFSGAVPRTTRC